MQLLKIHSETRNLQKKPNKCIKLHSAHPTIKNTFQDPRLPLKEPFPHLQRINFITYMTQFRDDKGLCDTWLQHTNPSRDLHKFSVNTA